MHQLLKLYISFCTLRCISDLPPDLKRFESSPEDMDFMQVFLLKITEVVVLITIVHIFPILRPKFISIIFVIVIFVTFVVFIIFIGVAFMVIYILSKPPVVIFTGIANINIIVSYDVLFWIDETVANASANVAHEHVTICEAEYIKS